MVKVSTYDVTDAIFIPQKGLEPCLQKTGKLAAILAWASALDRPF
jgi:hypothetical protein